MTGVKIATALQFTPQKAIVIDDDDDEIIALDGPSEVPKRNETTIPEVVHLSNTQPTTQDTFPHSSRQSTSDASYEHTQSPPDRTSGTKDKQIRIIDDPFIVPDFIPPPPTKPPQTSSCTKISEFVDLTISNDEGDGSDDALEYLTPAPTSKQAVEAVHEEAPILTSIQAHPSPKAAHSAVTMTNTSKLLNHLLTRWLNDRYTSVGVTPDIWARACLRRDPEAANRKSLGSKSAHSPSISPPSRRKFKALKLSETSPSQATVFLSAKEWLHEKRTSLLLE